MYVSATLNSCRGRKKKIESSETIKEKCNLNIKKIDLTKIIHDFYIPCYFICSKEDTFIKCEHTEHLYMRYNGQKWIEYVLGNHNSERS